MSSVDLTPRPILFAPICSHQSYGLLEMAIPNIEKSLKKLNKNAVMVNIASDGDAARRKTLNKMRRLNKSLPVLKLLNNFDLNLVCGEYSVNFDPKHIVKRIRSIIISKSRSMLLNKIHVNVCQVEELLKINNYSNTSDLLNPRDKQNVPKAVALLKLIHEFTVGPAPLDPIKKDVFNELKLLGILSSLLLSIFINLDINLIDQLLNLAHLSHLLLFIFRRHSTKFLTNNLYSDIQSTIADAFVVTAKFQLKGYSS